MVLKSAGKLLAAAGLCGLLAVELPGQGGLGAPPGQMSGGGVRGGSSGRAARPSGQIPSRISPSDSSTNRSDSTAPVDQPQGSASRPAGNILSPGGSSSRGSILTPGSPGGAGQSGNILSPGLPGPYRPGNILTPGTPNPPAPHPGGISGSDMRNRAPDFSRGRFGRHGKSVIVVPYVYFGYPNGYADGGYAVENGGVSRTNSHASYTVEGHLDRTREPHSRVYEVGPGAYNPQSGVAAQTENETAENETAAEPVEYLIALKGGLVYVSREHWLLGDTVHFVTLQGDHYVVSLDELDMDLSAKLNRERGLKLVLEVREHGPGAPAAP